MGYKKIEVERCFYDPFDNEYCKDCEYYRFHKGRDYMPNGDPGYPDEVDCLKCDFDPEFCVNSEDLAYYVSDDGTEFDGYDYDEIDDKGIIHFYVEVEDDDISDADE